MRINRYDILKANSCLRRLRTLYRRIKQWRKSAV